MLRALFFSVVCGGMLFSVLPLYAFAQTVHQDFQETLRAEVVRMVDEYEREVTGTGSTVTVQEVEIEIVSGERTGEQVIIENEVVDLAVGDTIFVFRTESIDGSVYYTYADFERRPILAVVTFIFVALLLFFSRWQGVRALLSLGASVAAILFLLVPAILAGYDPTISTVVIAGVVMACVLFGTHGINPRSTIAFGGTFAAVTVTGVIAYISVDLMRLTGFSNDASVYLNFATGGELDLSGILLASIIIGLLGVLDDVSITQASVVQQLKAANPTLNFFGLYARAIIVGRDHIGSLVNTLALAYAGVALPLILLYAKTESNLLLSMNQEVVAAELIRIIIGSIGLILAVPATTAVAAWYFNDREVDNESDSLHHHHHHH